MSSTQHASPPQPSATYPEIPTSPPRKASACPPATHLRTGARGEDIAVRHLEKMGMAILERNWTCPHGEIDIIALHQGAVVFVEVKTRSTEMFGHPALAVDRRKQGKLRKLAYLWLRSHALKPARVRIDVVAILDDEAGPARIDHYEGVC